MLCVSSINVKTKLFKTSFFQRHAIKINLKIVVVNIGSKVRTSLYNFIFSSVLDLRVQGHVDLLSFNLYIWEFSNWQLQKRILFTNYDLEATEIAWRSLSIRKEERAKNGKLNIKCFYFQYKINDQRTEEFYNQLSVSPVFKMSANWDRSSKVAVEYTHGKMAVIKVVIKQVQTNSPWWYLVHYTTLPGGKLRLPPS